MTKPYARRLAYKGICKIKGKQGAGASVGLAGKWQKTGATGSKEHLGKKIKCFSDSLSPRQTNIPVD